MENILADIGDVWWHQAQWFAGLFVMFTALAKLSPAVRGQPLWRSEFKTDILYWFLMPLLMTPIFWVLMTLGVLAVEAGEQTAIDALLKNGRAPVNAWPVWLQCLIVLFISDVLQYWIHRAFHTARFWRWHAIHHMSTQLDWLSCVRFHPVNIMISVTLVGVLTKLFGFTPQAFVYLTVFNTAYSAFVHANLDWHFGPLRYVLASPVFHRWHHTGPQAGGDKNFAPTFPFLDVLFGTFYMPKHDRPEAHGFGVKEAIPSDDLIAQTLWPFRSHS